MKTYFLDILFNKYATFIGRASRKEFWMFNLIYILVALILFFTCLIVAMLTNTSGSIGYPVGIIIFFLATIIPSIALTARRLHDAGLSAWLLLIGLLAGNIVFLIYGLIPGTNGPNSYGEKPSI